MASFAPLSRPPAPASDARDDGASLLPSTPRGWRQALMWTCDKDPAAGRDGGASRQLRHHVRGARRPWARPAISRAIDRRFDRLKPSRFLPLDASATLWTTRESSPHHFAQAQGEQYRSHVALDSHTGRHVRLTVVPKAMASASQVAHVQRVLLTLRRSRGFQRLESVLEDGACWVFVQDHDVAWTPLDTYWDATASEPWLREVMFRVVSMVHFLHSHGLSAAGQLAAPQNFMVHSTTRELVWLVSPVQALFGCHVVPATTHRIRQDIIAVGTLMVELSMLEHIEELASIDDPAELERVIHQHLSFLSAPCRGVILSCLVEQTSASDLLRRKWLRHVDFVAIAPRLDVAVSALTPSRRLALNCFLWKIATCLMMSWLGGVLHGPLLSISPPHSCEEEDVETARQRTRKSSPKRSSRKLHLTGLHHSLSGSSGGLLKRGIAIVPPLGTAVLPHSPSDDDASTNVEASEDKLVRSFHSMTLDGDALTSGDGDASANTKTTYDLFEFDLQVPEYDAFGGDGEDSYFLVEADALEDDVVEDSNGRRSRSSSVVVHEQHSNASIASMKDRVLRSVNANAHSWSSSTGSSEDAHVAQLLQAEHPLAPSVWLKESLDAVYLSAFGPDDISFRDIFRVDIWAYLRQQRQEMLETALECSDGEVGKRVQPMGVARGTLITVLIEPSDCIGVLGDDCKSFRWRGDVNGVSFELYRKATPSCVGVSSDVDDTLCIARIVAGASVSLLYIRLRASSAPSEQGVTPLSTRLEHLTTEVTEIPPAELEIVRPVGKGAFGEAMLARWTERSVDVVLKYPHRDAFRDSETLEAFRHEAAVMHMLGKHPHVVELLGLTASTTGASSSPPALVTEYLSNGSLHDVLTRSPAPSSSLHWADASHLSLFSRTVMARDAAHGIVNIHQAHVLHRDIAARNCLLDDQFRVKVCDFGLSRLTKSTLYFDDEHHGFGPIKWMAPESVLPPHLFSTHSDAYMFGVLMYEIFTGSLPFPGISSREALTLILEGQHVPIPEHLPRTHKELMLRCFDPHPLHRPTMDQVFVTLDQWILHDTRYDSRRLDCI
ncbi:hypothetical protein ATCC90586_008315 [Pythium insidiosum]|nr:hypothetical protein ATCC90586_008315 [Pythium insidiosum]